MLSNLYDEYHPELHSILVNRKIASTIKKKLFRTFFEIDSEYVNRG